MFKRYITWNWSVSAVLFTELTLVFPNSFLSILKTISTTKLVFEVKPLLINDLKGGGLLKKI